MLFATVRGTVVATTNEDRIDGGRYLLVSPTTPDGRGGDPPFVALDLVRANRGQLVLVAQGSSCRQSMYTKDTAVDAVIVGIVHSVSREVMDDA